MHPVSVFGPGDIRSIADPNSITKREHWSEEVRSEELNKLQYEKSAFSK
jgi:hypothetical protein